MKAISIVVAFALMSFYVKAQAGNLQYSETKTIILTGPMLLDGQIDAEDLVVLPGQTWKVESAVCSIKFSSGGSTSYSHSSYVKVVLDDVLIYSYDSFIPNNYPIWLAEGTHPLVFWNDTTWSSSYTGHAIVTILVFNIVP